MKNKKIYLTEEDYAKILKALQEHDNGESTSFLLKELSRAEIVPEEEIDGSVVTLHSKVIVEEVPSRQDREVIPVLPEQAHWAGSYESVLSPTGATIIGLREGDALEWCSAGSSDKRVYKVKKVLFQPEAENRICVAS